MTAPRTSAATRGMVPPFYVMRVIDAVVAKRAAGFPVIDLSAGQPSTAAPAAVRAAAAAAVQSEILGYSERARHSAAA